MGKVKETPWLLLLQEKHLGENQWWLNFNQDKQKQQSVGEQTRTFAAPFIEHIFSAAMKQHKDSFTKQ